PTEKRAPDRIRADVAWLSDPAREGRGIGSAGLDAAGGYLEARMRELGLLPAGENDRYGKGFHGPVSVRLEASSSVSVGGLAVAAEAFAVPGFSSSATVEAPLVLAGYGIADAKIGRDDYAGLKVKDRIVLVRRFVPEKDPPFSSTEAQR